MVAGRPGVLPLICPPRSGRLGKSGERGLVWGVCQSGGGEFFPGLPDSRSSYPADCQGHFLEKYLYQLQRAVDEGVEIRGYFLWTFLDNFEWANGALRISPG